MEIIAGVDEAGRGPLAGPVMAAAVILNPAKPIDGLKDSKLLTPKKRDYLFCLIQERALAWAVACASVEEIEEINILQASLLAMKRAVNALTLSPQQVLVDGNQLPSLSYPAQAIVRGDQTVPAISAASILAKVTRDQEMMRLDVIYPDYGFKQHKGYGTALHFRMLKEKGLCPIHRKRFCRCD